jgi:hypothetical protein
VFLNLGFLMKEWGNAVLFLIFDYVLEEVSLQQADHFLMLVSNADALCSSCFQ